MPTDKSQPKAQRPPSDEQPAVTQAVTTNVNPAADSDDDRHADDGMVELYMAYPQDTFRYGDADSEVIEGHKGKRLSRSEADKVLQKANSAGVQVLERGVGDDS